MAQVNLRNALMAGKRLPYDAEVEYLQSSGTQWIDTGVVATNNTRVKVAFSDYTQSGAWLFGARRGFRNAALGVYTDTGSTNNNWRRAFGNYISDYFTFSTIDLGVSTFDYNCGHFTGTREKVPITVDFTDTASAFDSSPYNIYLWTVNLAGTPGIVSSAKIYATQIWQNGVLVRDFIPVRKGTVGYLYDRVSGKLFGNAGTGDFVLGQDVVPVEYIESHGTEYIDTGVYGSQNLRTTFDYQLVYSGTAPVAKGLFGCYTSGMKYHLYCSGAAPSEFQVGMGNTYLNTIRVDNVRHSIKFDDGAVSIDGNVVATFGTYEYTTAHTLLLFALQNASGGLYSMTPMRKWRVQMWDNGTPVRDYVPVRVGSGSTWEGAMMDVLTRRIYRNAGTGAFTFGNDLKYPIPAE